MGHQVGNSVSLDYVDKRRSMRAGGDPNTRTTKGQTLFTMNAGGSTTTMLGADGVVATSANVLRLGDKFKLFTAAGVLKEETVFTVTGLASAAGTTTVTFSPAAAVATASTNIARGINYENFLDEANLDTRLIALGYSVKNIGLMTQNDKVFAIRQADDSASI